MRTNRKVEKRQIITTKNRPNYVRDIQPFSQPFSQPHKSEQYKHSDRATRILNVDLQPLPVR